MQEMESTFQELAVQPPMKWSDSELCILMSNRMATLLKQIGAFCITKECQFSFEQIRERLAMFGEIFDETQSKAIFELLQSLTKDISEGDIARAIYEVTSAVEENLEEIKDLDWTGNPDLARDVEKALKSHIGKEEGMKALIIGLVHEIISLFGLGLKDLISVIKAEFPKVFLDWQAIEAFEESVALPQREFEREEPTQVLDDYLNLISVLNLPRYFPYQPLKDKEYRDVSVTARALSNLINSHNQWRNMVDVQESKIRELKSTYKNDKHLLVEEKAELCREKAEMAVAIIEIMSEKETLSTENDQLKAEKTSRMEEIETLRRDNESALALLDAKNSRLESQLKELSERKYEADKIIRNFSQMHGRMVEAGFDSFGLLIADLLKKHYRECRNKPDQLMLQGVNPFSLDRVIQMNRSESNGSETNTQPPNNVTGQKK